MGGLLGSAGARPDGIKNGVATWREARIVIVDDMEPNIRLLRYFLARAGYINIHSFMSGQAALDSFEEEPPDLILLDLHMPHMTGAELMERLSSTLLMDARLPVLVLTGDANPETKRTLLGAGAMDFVTKPFDMDEILLRVRNLLQIRSLHLHMEARIAERTSSLQSAHKEILDRLVIAGEFHDDDTGQHARRVGDVAARLAQLLEYPDEEVELIRRAAPLHDVGKIAVPDTILLKQGELTEEERDRMKQHTTSGAQILENSTIKLIQVAEKIALCHHEKWDGSGYPAGLKGEEIPKVARIVAVADVYDALAHDRPYRRAWPLDRAIGQIREGSGTHFDPEVVAAFQQLMRDSGGAVASREVAQSSEYGMSDN